MSNPRPGLAQKTLTAALGLLRKLVGEAAGVLRDPQRRDKLLGDAKNLLQNIGTDPAFAELKDQLLAVVRLVKASSAGEYKMRSKNSLYLAVGGLLYLVMPFDIIPDFLPGGYLDDAAVLTFVISQLSRELDRFREWEKWREEFREDGTSQADV